jgi:hypothetical protein
LTERNIPHQIVLAGTWKSALGIKGRVREEQKKNAQAWVVNNFKVSPTQDECDAICIGQYCSNKAIEEDAFDWS